jgi:dTDP-4-dehydrorhamnose 3,5-epimerase
MELTPLSIDGVWLAESPTFNDDRGHFREWFKYADISSKTGINFKAMQANMSKSRKNVIRGIHFSLAPEGQDKWVTCIEGSITDVVVDIRVNSPTFGKYLMIELDGRKGNSLIITSGLGHAFLSRTDSALVAYLMSSSYSSENEYQINPFDPDLGILWDIDADDAILSGKDKSAPTLNELLMSRNLPSWNVWST